MNFCFENQGTHTYLVYTVAEDDIIDSMSLGMLTNNKINGLAHTLFTQMDSIKFIKYDVSAKISVKQFFSGQVNKKRLIGVFRGIVDAMLSAEDYMIDVNSILLDLDYIFADVSTCETVLICMPIVSDDLSVRDLGMFFKNIMFTTQFDQTENCDHVAKIINYLNSSPVFSLAEFNSLLEAIEGNCTPTPVKQQPAVQSQQPQPTVQSSQPAVTKPQSQPKPQPVVTAVNNASPASVQMPPTPIQTPSTPVTTPPSAQGQEKAEKQISMMDLLMHYSKENAELYKKQKAAKKAAKGGTPQQKSQSSPTGFSVPGQSAPSSQSFSIPGQSAPSQRRDFPGASKPVDNPVNTPSQQPQQPQPVYTPPQTPQGHSASFGETTVLGGGGGIGETTVLGATPAVQSTPHLIRVKNNEKINLDKPVFRIGKEKSYVDYFIGDNSAISRSHANIISRDGEYFVVDTNSTNHTYVNGQMIQSNVETKITHGTKVKLANEDFEFRLY